MAPQSVLTPLALALLAACILGFSNATPTQDELAAGLAARPASQGALPRSSAPHMSNAPEIPQEQPRIAGERTFRTCVACLVHSCRQMCVGGRVCVSVWGWEGGGVGGQSTLPRHSTPHTSDALEIPPEQPRVAGENLL